MKSLLKTALSNSTEIMFEQNNGDPSEHASNQSRNKKLNQFKMNIQSIKSIALLVITILFLSSCEKENFLTEDESGIASIESSELFQFTDIGDFQSYYEQHNTLYDADFERFNEIASAVPVQTIHQKMENDVFTNPEARYMTFLHDPVMASIVNEHYEFQIADFLFTIIDNEFMLRIKAVDDESRDQIRMIVKGANWNTKMIPESAEIVSDDNFEGLVAKSTISNKDVENAQGSFKANCVDEEAATIWDWEQVGNYGLSSRVRAYYAYNRTYEEARVFSYKKLNGSWSNEDVFSLWAEIEAHRRNSSCNVIDYEDEYESCASCSHARARVSKWGKKHHQTHDVKGDFRLNYAFGFDNSFVQNQVVQFN